jgi:GNAT superfamily N-acetyltransferase
MTMPDPADEPSATTPGAHATKSWIPIRSLSAYHRDAVLEHLIALPERDRYLRFGYRATDEQIRHHVEGLDFDRDEIFGVFNRRLEIVAMAHIAYPDRELAATHPAEFGVSVLPHLRGRGLGKRLFEHAMLHVRNRGLSTMYVHALTENAAMLHIASSAGATVEHSCGESDAHLLLPQDTLASHAEALIGEGAAALDYGLKQQARFVDSLLDAIGDAKSDVGKTDRTDES